MPGVVVCPQPRAADVGVDILSRGGTAFDAAIATAFAQMINDPFMGGIGGMGTLHYHRADTGESGILDFYNRAGSRVTADMWKDDCRGRTEISGYSLFDDFRSEVGFGAIMTPGTVAGLGTFHEMLGTMPWADLLAPAIAHAHEGVIVTPHARQVWLSYNLPGTPDGLMRLKTTPESERIYVHPEGRFYEVGERLMLPDYGATLQRIADKGWREFYTGELGDTIIRDLEANGSFITRGDFASYKPDIGRPVEGTYRGFTVRSNRPPGSGVTIIEMLNILEQFDVGGLEHSSVEHLDLLARVMTAAHWDRNRYLGDPRFVDVPVDMLISKDRAAYWAGKIRHGETLEGGAEDVPSCTTHVTILDDQGNAVSLTHTLGTTAGVVTPGLGFPYNNSMKLFDPIPGRMNSMAPGKARTTGMVPTMLLKDGKPVLVVGAPGGSVIISAVLQAIINIIDFGMSPVEAVTVPRIHCEGAGIHAEATVQGAVVDELRAKGHKVIHSPYSYEPKMSRAHVATAFDGQVRAGADPRGGGGIAFTSRLPRGSRV